METRAMPTVPAPSFPTLVFPDTQTPFRYFVQMALPAVYGDELSYYELLSKIVDTLNKTLENVNVLNKDVQELAEFTSQLSQWVQDYFKNLDIQAEIDKKLDQMVADGTFARMLADFMGAYYITPKLYGITVPTVQNMTEFVQYACRQGLWIAFNEDFTFPGTIPVSDVASLKVTTFGKAVVKPANPVISEDIGTKFYISMFEGTNVDEVVIRDFNVQGYGNQTASVVIRPIIGSFTGGSSFTVENVSVTNNFFAGTSQPPTPTFFNMMGGTLTIKDYAQTKLVDSYFECGNWSNILISPLNKERADVNLEVRNCAFNTKCTAVDFLGNIMRTSGNRFQIDELVSGINAFALELYCDGDDYRGRMQNAVDNCETNVWEGTLARLRNIRIAALTKTQYYATAIQLKARDIMIENVECASCDRFLLVSGSYNPTSKQPFKATAPMGNVTLTMRGCKSQVNESGVYFYSVFSSNAHVIDMKGMDLKPMGVGSRFFKIDGDSPYIVCKTSQSKLYTQNQGTAEAPVNTCFYMPNRANAIIIDDCLVWNLVPGTLFTGNTGSLSMNNNVNLNVRSGQATYEITGGFSTVYNVFDNLGYTNPASAGE